MLQALKKLMASFSLAILMAVPVTAGLSTTVHAAIDCEGIQGCLDQGSCETDPANCGTTDVSTRVGDIIRLVINIFSLVVGVIAVIMIIVGGLKYITSGGDSANVTSAKNTILYAIIGLVVVALAQIIVRFVLDKVTTQ